jgi:hypothetical protein
MSNSITLAKACVMAASTLAIALLIVGMGVNSTYAGSDRPPTFNYSQIPGTITHQPLTSRALHNRTKRQKTAQSCGQACGSDDQPLCPSGCHCYASDTPQRHCRP